MIRYIWGLIFGLSFSVNSCFACICNESTPFSLELVDQTPVIADIRFDASSGLARVVRGYKGMLPDSISFDSADCTGFEDGALYHIYFSKKTADRLSLSDAVRCKRLYQDLKEFVQVTGVKGNQPEQYNAFITTIKKTHQELVILRALKDQYSGKIKHNLLLTDDLKNVDDFTVVKGRVRNGKRVGKWIYYEWDSSIPGSTANKWVRKSRRY